MTMLQFTSFIPFLRLVYVYFSVLYVLKQLMENLLKQHFRVGQSYVKLYKENAIRFIF